MRSRWFAFFLAWVELMAIAKTSPAKDHVAGNLIQFNSNGAWCWYQDPRLVVDPANDTLLVSSIAASDGFQGDDRGGDVDVVAYHFETGASTRFVLHHHFEPQDDHNAAALLIRPDGRYLAVYSLHNHENLTYWRVSTNPHDATDWGPEKTFDWSSDIKAAGAKSHVTYSNLYYLTAEKRLYDFSRAINDDPSILVSTNQGDDWSYLGKLLTEEKLGYVNGYTKYASNGVDRIDFITTDHHPRDYNNNIYHGYIKGGKLYNSDGAVINGDLSNGPGHSQTELTTVFAANSMFGGTIMTHDWTIELAIDAGGNPYGVISCRANDQPENSNFDDHRFFYIRFDGKRWQVNELAKAGACLWPAEQDYTGLATVDPADPNVVYISTTIDPRSDSPMPVHEIFRGQTTNSGHTWSWTALTSDSSVDNLRPLAVSHGDSTVLVWLRGTMSRSQHYDSAMVGTIIPKDGSEEKVQYVANPNADQSANSTDAPMKASLPKLDAGAYNIYVFFWSDPKQDTHFSAGLNPDELVEFRARSCQSAEASQFAQPVQLTESNRLLYRAFLGRVKSDGTQSVEVTARGHSGNAAFAGLGYQKAN